jgi:uncharacterized protein (DUF885 family)
MNHNIRSAAAVAALLLGLSAEAAPADDLHAVLADYDKYTNKIDPIGAGRRGDLDAARRWPDHSPAAVEDKVKALTAFKQRLDAIDAKALAGEDSLNHALLRWRVGIDLEGEGFDEERIPFTSDSTFFQSPGYMANGTRLKTAAEAEAYLARLEALPDFFAVETANMRRGLATGWVQPRIVVEEVIELARNLAGHKPEDSALLVPIAKLPATMPEAEREAFRKRALDIVTAKVKPAEQAVVEFLAKEYLPKSRDSLGAASLPNGRAYYAYRVRRETTTDMTPDQIYDLGRAEIARIRGEMDKIIRETGFTGSFQEFQSWLRKDPQFYVTTREALMEKASRLAKRVDNELPGYFGLLPRLTYGVRQVPADIEEGYTTGRYNGGSPEQGIAGGLMINTSHLDQRPLYELPALVAHEGVPGHHLQIALSQEQKDVPQFRKREGITAFVEGWALYSEQLAGEFGLYTSPYERFGMLSMEMWRACRLVMDTGIHWKGMGRDEARSCLRDNSALAEQNIRTETDRYISWPGQALGYKIGELKIMELRRKAEAALGTAFDIRKFHDVVLDEGAMPMVLLEARVDNWIGQQKK